ncbi:hypothetical protein ACFW1A_05035 [Kitasatospora sp. NPDC058965]|uniref:hypothetical protein n=1 Tax=Kitasatospora sp. NPDC058965 TaxID=3346682 RepID=UPI0036920DF6
MTEDDARIAGRLKQLADRQVTGGPVPAADLIHRGRRTRRLRTLGGTAVGAGGVALACTVCLALVPGTTDRATLSPAAQSSPATPATTATTAPPTDPAITTTRLLALLAAKVPADLHPSNPYQLDETARLPWLRQLTAAYTVSDGAGTGSVRVEVRRTTPPPGGTLTPTPCAMPGCTVTPEPGGSYLTVYLPDRAAGGEQDWRATVDRPDGTSVTVSAGNLPAPGSDRKVPYPNAPLLTGGQLSSLALDPAWHQAAASLPAPLSPAPR